MRRAILLAGKSRNPSLDLNFLGGALDPRITFTRASTASYFDVAGTLQSAATNTPRYDYDPVTHALRGLLIEEPRTNLVLNSATLVTQSVTVTAAATTLSFYGTGSVALSGVFTGSLAGTGAFPARVSLTFTPTAGTLTLTVTGSVTQAQCETGGFSSSYVPTTGAAATRALDVATLPTASFLGTGLQGSLAAEYQTIHGNAISSEYAADVNDNSTANRYAIRLDTAGTQSLSTLTISASVAVQSAGLANNVAGVPSKAAMSWSPGAQAACGNGGTVSATSSVAPVGPLSFMNIGSTGGTGGSAPANAYIRRVRFWPRPLSNAELQANTL